MGSRRFLALGAAIALVIGVAPTSALAEEVPAGEASVAVQGAGFLNEGDLVKVVQ